MSPPILNRLRKLEHKCKRHQNHHTTDRKNRLAGEREHQRIEPVLVQQIHQRDIADHQHHHREILLLHFPEHGFQLVVDDSHICQFPDDGQERIFQRPVILTGNQGIAPFLKDSVVYLLPQIPQSLFHVGGDHHGIAYEGLENLTDRWFQIGQVLVHRAKDVIGSDI